MQVYVDAKKTVAEGRKLPQSQCVEYPQMQELKEELANVSKDKVKSVSESEINSLP